MPIIARTDKNITVLIPDVRLSFCYADKPYVNVDKKTGVKKASHKTHGIFAAGSAAHLLLKEACREAAILGWGTSADQMLMQIQAQDKLCYHDGNVSGSSAGQEPYAGKLFVSVNSERRPRCIISRGGVNVDVDANDPMFPYSGCWANLMADIWPQKADSGWGIRINAGWTGVQFLRHDEAFSGGGRMAAPEEFPVVDTAGADAPAPGAAAGGPSLL